VLPPAGSRRPAPLQGGYLCSSWAVVPPSTAPTAPIPLLHMCCDTLHALWINRFPRIVSEPS